MVNEQDLDPATLRAVAEMTDQRAEFYAGQCPCHLHRALRNYSLQLAADLHTRAIRIEQRRAVIAKEKPPVLAVPRSMVTARTRRAEPNCPTCGRSALDGHNHR